MHPNGTKKLMEVEIYQSFLYFSNTPDFVSVFELSILICKPVMIRVMGSRAMEKPAKEAKHLPKGTQLPR